MKNEDILNAARTAFIDDNFTSISDIRPKLLYNNKSSKVINSIREELRNCDEFILSAAFITMGGLTPLLEEFKKLEQNNIKGKILTTDYLNFTEPKALKKLQSFKNIEVKLYSQEKEGFHTKGYIFKRDDVYRAIVGSSNLTLNALSVNKEWNMAFTSLSDGEIIKNLISEFNTLWCQADNLCDVLPYYKKIYKDYRSFQKLKQAKPEIKEKLIPNSMQEHFIDNLRALIEKGEDKALLVSATGTGKTYASAFAIHDFNPKKFLFLVHREQIAKQSIEAYKNVFENDKFGLLTGNSKDYAEDYLFATVQTMSKEEVYNRYSKDEFDFIIIDEVHKAGAFSYQKIFNYFEPKFWLGMTASPERTDGFDIYEMFDHNIAHEIRLQEALEQDLLCPFHYFGISDVEFENYEVGDNFRDFNLLASSKRVEYLLKQSMFYGYSGDRIKALVFCSSKKEAKLLSKEFTKRGHPSCALTGDNSQSERLDAIDRLTNDNAHNKLEYIFTVDIFNEGVDIPEINQILLVRPTESPIIFIQQLGRGLRKFKGKEYVVILDFIGNYQNNFMIPIALSGDRSFDKDNIRRFLIEGNKIIPGASSINFDEISKEKIFNSINNTNFSKIAVFKEKYNNLKHKLGKIPMLVDFIQNSDFNPELILNHPRFDCYYSFVKYMEDDYGQYLSDNEIYSLKMISKVLTNGMRPHEAVILKCLMYNKHFTVDKIQKVLGSDDLSSIEGAINVLNLNFFTDKEKEKYGLTTFFNNDYTISDEFDSYLANNVYRKYLNDVLDYILSKYENVYKSSDVLKLYGKYSRKDVCRLLNWPHDDSSTIYGYRVKHNTCPIFVTYEKKEDIADSTKYEDQFLSKEIFSWMTRSRLTLQSKEVQAIKNYRQSNLNLYLFVKKSDDEGKDFYYMGYVHPINCVQTSIVDDKGNDLPIVNFIFELDEPVKDEIYDYFIN